MMRGSADGETSIPSAWVLVAMLLVTTSACSEPQCPENKQRIGMRCVSRAGSTDSAVEPSASTARDAASLPALADGSADTDEDEVSEPAPQDAGVVPDADKADALAPTPQAAEASVPDAAPGCVPAAERCNGRDDDCDQQIDEDATDGQLDLACDNGGQGTCARTGKYICSGGAVICDVPSASGLKNACGGSSCGADLDDKGKPCTVVVEDCVGTGVWVCNTAAGSNELRCEVSTRTARNLALDPGFEQQATYSVSPPWGNFAGAFISSDPFKGSKSATVEVNKQHSTADVPWNDIFQQVAVIPGVTYRWEAWVKTTANFTYGRIGARSHPDWTTELAPDLGYRFGHVPAYTHISTRFTATTSTATAYIGGSDDTAPSTLIVDEVVLTRENACL